MVMHEVCLEDFPNVNFGKNVRIKARTIVIEDGATIGDDVLIEAKNIKIGFETVIEHGTKIRGINGTMTDFLMGDNSFVGFDCQILVPYFSAGDFSQIHNGTLASGYQPLTLGHNCWVGQGSILNSFERLTLGDNVRMGGSQIWTHVASGELLEGSNFYGSQPVTLEDNVWLMGFGHLISPGVTLGRNSVIMAGSVVTKNTEPYKTYSGIPARDITEKLPAWKPMTRSEKSVLIKKFIAEFVEQFPMFSTKIIFVDKMNVESDLEKLGSTPMLVVAEDADLEKFKDHAHSIYDLSTKMYLKRRIPVEISWMRFIVGFRARFLPFSVS